MQLKRRYDIPDGWEAQHNVRDMQGQLPDPDREDGALLNPLPVKSVAIVHTGVDQKQNFSRRLIDAGVAEGWVTLSRGMITLHTEEADLAYTILHMPGRYCLHCEQHFPTDPTGSESRRHLAVTHPGAESPDAQWPHGYKVLEGYECLLDAAQHEAWKSPAYATVSHARWKEKKVEEPVEEPGNPA